MNRLTQMIKEDMKPALGVTEPGAIAFAAAKARSYTHGPIESVMVSMNSGMYKNAFTCGIPNSNEVGNIFSAALGVLPATVRKVWSPWQTLLRRTMKLRRSWSMKGKFM